MKKPPRYWDYREVCFFCGRVETDRKFPLKRKCCKDFRKTIYCRLIKTNVVWFNPFTWFSPREEVWEIFN